MRRAVRAIRDAVYAQSSKVVEGPASAPSIRMADWR